MSGYHHVEDVMGTAVSIDVYDPVSEPAGLAELVAWLHHVDATFSTYKEDSPISRLGRGEMSLEEAGVEVVDVLRRCEELRAETGGAFDVFAVPAPNGTSLDPSGFVKGWAIERGAAILERHGLRRFCLNAGGDVALRGTPDPGPVWRVGIRDPHDDAHLATLLTVEGPLGVATSACYERGAHIRDPLLDQPVTELASATVIGPDLGTADAFATALYVMGASGLQWLESRPGYHGLVLGWDGEIRSSLPPGAVVGDGGRLQGDD